MAYREHPDRSNFERKWLADLVQNDIQQGIYVAAPSGKFLGRMNRGWPDPDPVEMLAAMKEAVARYRRLGADRRLSKPLSRERDRLRWERDAFVKPAGTLDLQVSRRGYAFAGMTSFDQRNPMYFHMDHVWFKPSEWRAFLPNPMVAGSKRRVTGPARTRFVLLSQMQAGQSAWWEEHIRGGSTTATVTSVEGDLVRIRLDADYDMKADSQWCKDTYLGRALGYATFNRKESRFVRFDLVFLGTHTVGQMMSNLHVGSPTQRIAAFATLSSGSDPDSHMLPANWKYGYGLDWCRTP